MNPKKRIEAICDFADLSRLSTESLRMIAQQGLA